MTDDAQRGTPPDDSSDDPTVLCPTLGRGIVWSDLVREMEQEWTAEQRRRAEVCQTVTELPRSATGDTVAGHDGGKAA